MAGPCTLDDEYEIITPLSQFKFIMSQPGLDVQFDDIVVGVLFGKYADVSDAYMVLNAQYPVLCGANFWLHLTGDKSFYNRILKAIGEVLDEGDFEGSEHLQAEIKKIAEEIKQECAREI